MSPKKHSTMAVMVGVVLLFALVTGVVTAQEAFRTESVFEREPIRIQSDDMRILRGKELGKHLRESFREAEDRVWISTFTTSDPSVNGSYMDRTIEPLRKAIQQGLDVRLVMPDELAKNKRLAPKFEEAGFKVALYDGDAVMHTKVILVDDEQVYGGSANFATLALARKAETTIWQRNQEMNRRLEDYFKTLWKERSTDE